MFYRSEDVFDWEILGLISCKQKLVGESQPRNCVKELSLNNDEKIEPKPIEKKTGKSDHISHAPQFGL